MKSLPVAVKVGGVGVLGGGGIAGTGLLIHDQIQKKSKTVDYKLTSVDEQLLNEDDSAFTWDSSFVLGNENKTATISVSASLKEKSSNSWKCTIKGIVKDSENPNLSIEDNSSTFNKGVQLSKFTTKFTDTDHKKSNKDGFIKSCSKNRTDEQRNNKPELVSEIRVELKKIVSGTDANKYEFQDEDLKKVFSGDWVNSPDLK